MVKRKVFVQELLYEKICDSIEKITQHEKFSWMKNSDIVKHYMKETGCTNNQAMSVYLVYLINQLALFEKS